MRRAGVVALVILLMAGGLAGCKEVRLGSRCKGGAATSGAWIVTCKKGRWTKWITRSQGQQLLAAYLKANAPVPPPAPPSAAPTPPTPTPPAEPEEPIDDPVETFRVGVDLAPGTYRGHGADCQWQVVSDLSGSIESVDRNGSGSTPQLVSVDSSDAALQSIGCGTWSAEVGATTQFTDAWVTVGSSDGRIPAGTYTTRGDDCGWLRLGADQEVRGGDLADGRSFMQVRAGDDAVVTFGGCSWLPATGAATTYPAWGDGTYRVGIEIQPGRIRIPGGPQCRWYRLDSLDGSADSLIDGQVGADPTVATIAAGDVALQTEGCGSWSLPPTMPAQHGSVWVALRGSGAIARINPVTLAVQQTIPLGASELREILVVGQKVWYSDQSGIGMYDLATRVNRPGLITLFTWATLAWSPTRPNVLFAGLTNVSGSLVTAYDISGTTPIELPPLQYAPDVEGTITGLTVSPDGTKLWSTTRVSPITLERNIADGLLTGRRFVGTEAFTTGAASGGSATRPVIAQGYAGARGNDVVVFDPVTGTAIAEQYRTTRPFDTGDAVVALSTDGSRIYSANGIQPGFQSGIARLTTIDRPTGTTLSFPLPGRTIEVFVEPTTGRVFVSDGTAVEAFDPDGWPAGEISGLANPAGFAAAS